MKGDPDVFLRQIRISHALLEDATKEQLSDSVVLLAMMVAEYRGKYGEINFTKIIQPDEKMSEESEDLINESMGTLNGILEYVMHGRTGDGNLH
jgi:hypothetical protein